MLSGKQDYVPELQSSTKLILITTVWSLLEMNWHDSYIQVLLWRFLIDVKGNSSGYLWSNGPKWGITKSWTQCQASGEWWMKQGLGRREPRV
jgi:hypothetical protein